MKALENFLGLSRLAIGLILLGATVLGVWLVSSWWTSGATAKVEARLATEQAEAALESGAVAANVVAEAGAREAASDDLSRSNEREIRNAPGAASKLDPAVHAAGLRSLCQRAAYRERPECLQLVDP